MPGYTGPTVADLNEIIVIFAVVVVCIIGFGFCHFMEKRNGRRNT
jgi:hypothetical protein